MICLAPCVSSSFCSAVNLTDTILHAKLQESVWGVMSRQPKLTVWLAPRRQTSDTLGEGHDTTLPGSIDHYRFDPVISICSCYFHKPSYPPSFIAPSSVPKHVTPHLADTHPRKSERPAVIIVSNNCGASRRLRVVPVWIKGGHTDTMCVLMCFVMASMSDL